MRIEIILKGVLAVEHGACNAWRARAEMHKVGCRADGLFLRARALKSDSVPGSRSGVEDRKCGAVDACRLFHLRCSIHTEYARKNTIQTLS